MSLTAFLVAVGDGIHAADWPNTEARAIGFLSGLTKQPTFRHEIRGAVLLQSSVYLDESQVAVCRRTTAGRDVLVVFDGWLQNRDSLASELRQNVHRTELADSEIVLSAYLRWGDALTGHLEGEYSAVVLASTRGSMPEGIVFRDRVGVRPIFRCATSGSSIAFGNFPGGFSALRLQPLTVNVQCVQDFLDGQIGSPTSTFVEATERLLGGHHWMVRGVQCAPQAPYWQPPSKVHDAVETYDQVVFNLRRLIEDAVIGATACSYPVALQVSGGIDSSTVACIAADLLDAGRINSPHLRGLSQVYPGETCDESDYISAVAGVLPFPTSRIVPRYAAVEEMIDWEQRCRWPIFSFAGTSFTLPFQHQCALGGRVVVGGEGGDELFATTPDAFAAVSLSHRDWPAVWKFLSDRWTYSRSRFNLRGRVAYLLDGVLHRATQDRRSAGTHEAARWLPFGSRVHAGRTIAAQHCFSGAWAQVLEMTYWRTFVLGIDYRSPLLSARLIAYCAGLPLRFLDHGGRTRRLLRDAAGTRLPTIVRTRDTKSEFTGSVLPALLSHIGQRFSPAVGSMATILSSENLVHQGGDKISLWQSDRARAIAGWLLSRRT